MKKKSRKKLALTKNTLRRLSPEALNQIAGGNEPAPSTMPRPTAQTDCGTCSCTC